MIEPRQIGDIVSYDGTSIRYQRFGEGPPVVIANGIGVGYRGLTLQLEYLAQHFDLICWDYRGFFDSGPPGYGGPQMAAHGHTGARDPVLVGWSMGVSVGFEALGFDTGRFSRMACLDGVPTSPFGASPLVPLASRALPRALRAAAVTAPVVSPVLSRLLRSREFRPIAGRSGLLRRHAHPEAFEAMTHGVASHDLRLYLRTLAELGRSDTQALLPKVQIPLLFLVGEFDLFIPPWVVRRLARRAPNARLEVIPGASHFTVVEEPALVNQALEVFLRD